MNCIFCKIMNGEIPSYTIYEDEIVKVFLDVNPEVNGHMLIVPKKHYENIMDIEEDTLMHINKIAKKMYELLKEKMNVDGMTITQNNGSAQEVKHYHMHILPRFEKDGVLHIYPKDKLTSLEDIYQKLTK